MSARILRVLGNLLIAIVIIIAMPIAIPKIFGLQEYNVISGSMEPTISVGSIVYVKGQNWNQLSEGDIIAFESGASVVTHRIKEMHNDTMTITTKGDANKVADFNDVDFSNVIGRVVAHFPVYGLVAASLSETVGKIVAAIALVVGAILSFMADSKESKSDSKASKSKVNPKVVLLSGLVIVFGSIGGFLYIFMGYQKSNDLYDTVNVSYTKVEEETTSWEDMMDVDFDALQKINPDVIGWIYIEGTDISYPIMYSGDDEEYLRTTIDKQYATAGSIFLEGYNQPDFTDSHNIIYGHNMRNLSMFGTLKFYKTEENYFNDHRYFQIITPEAKMRYEIFSYFDTEPASWVYAVPYSDSAEFSDYISELVNHSYEKIDLGSNLTSKDQIVTLSTCSANEMRFTIHGALQKKMASQN